MEMSASSSADSRLANTVRFHNVVNVMLRSFRLLPVMSLLAILAASFTSACRLTDTHCLDLDVTCNAGLAAGIRSAAAGGPKDFTAFSIPSLSAVGVFSSSGIAMIAPAATTSLAGLVPTFTHSGASVSLNGITQTSGITSVDFTNPVTYTITAADGTKKDWVVAVYAPRTISSIAVWLSASSLALADGAAIAAWADQSGRGNGVNCSPCSPTFRVAQVNGLPIVRTAAAASGFSRQNQGTNGLWTGDSGSFFAFLKLGALPAGQADIFDLGQCGDGRNFWVDATGRVSQQRFCIGTNLTFNTPLGTTSFRMISVLQNGLTSMEGYLDGALDASVTGLGANATSYKQYPGVDPFEMFISNSSGGTDFGDFDIAEIMWFNTYLNAVDTKKIHCYLSLRYNRPLTGTTCP